MFVVFAHHVPNVAAVQPVIYVFDQGFFHFLRGSDVSAVEHLKWSTLLELRTSLWYHLKSNWFNLLPPVYSRTCERYNGLNFSKLLSSQTLLRRMSSRKFHWTRPVERRPQLLPDVQDYLLFQDFRNTGERNP